MFIFWVALISTQTQFSKFVGKLATDLTHSDFMPEEEGINHSRPMQRMKEIIE
ncbi:MAG: hypothetical protein ISR69_08780 [Gammaproteobacteria bacterium]|nr:hypothetical protein [Gammaproteobacteria bacterium]